MDAWILHVDGPGAIFQSSDSAWLGQTPTMISSSCLSGDCSRRYHRLSVISYFWCSTITPPLLPPSSSSSSSCLHPTVTTTFLWSSTPCFLFFDRTSTHFLAGFDWTLTFIKDTHFLFFGSPGWHCQKIPLTYKNLTLRYPQPFTRQS